MMLITAIYQQIERLQTYLKTLKAAFKKPCCARFSDSIDHMKCIVYQLKEKVSYDK